VRAPPGFMLVSGVATVGFGTFALIVGWRENDLLQLLIPAIVLGTILTGWAVIEAGRPKPEQPGDGHPQSPGRWFS